jgi:hypothetical protein
MTWLFRSILAMLLLAGEIDTAFAKIGWAASRRTPSGCRRNLQCAKRAVCRTYGPARASHSFHFREYVVAGGRGALLPPDFMKSAPQAETLAI